MSELFFTLLVAIPSYSEVLFLLQVQMLDNKLMWLVAIPSYSEVLFLRDWVWVRFEEGRSQSLLIQRSYSYEDHHTQ